MSPLLGFDRHCIHVWRFHEAPVNLRRCSPHGGDEDWLAFIPNRYAAEPWVEHAFAYDSPFGVCSVSTHRVEALDGIVKIGAHA